MKDGPRNLVACIGFSLLVAHGATSALHEHPGKHTDFAAPLDLQSLFQAWVESGTRASKNSKMMPYAKDYYKYRTKARPTWEAYNRTEWAMDQPKFTSLAHFANGPVLDNLCIDGKLVPELYVVGVVKAATTSLSSDLRQSPAIIWPFRPFWEYKSPDNDFVSGNTVKEAHFMDEFYFLGKKIMLESFPQCRVDTRVTAIEASPRYFMDPRVPQRIASWYGATYKPRLKFVALLRNAVDRFFSDYWHAKSDAWCIEYDNRTFNDVLEDIITGGAEKYKGGMPGCGDRLESSLYKTSLTRWFSNFSPRQFTVVPWLYQIRPGIHGRRAEPVAETIWDFFGLQKGPVRFDTHFNIHEHPPIQVDAEPEKLKTFTEFIANESSVETLAQFFAANPGVHLYQYKGQPTDEQAIGTWLRNNW